MKVLGPHLDVGSGMSLSSGSSLSFRNKLINGIPLIGQRGAVAIAAGASAYGPDRWLLTNNTNQSVTFDLYQYNGWSKSLRIYPTGTAPTTGSVVVEQRIENAVSLSPQARGCDGNATLYTEVDGYDPTIVLRQCFGTGGSPSSNVDTTLTVAKTSLGGSVNKYVGSVAVPSVSAKTFGSNNDHYTSLMFTVAVRSATCNILISQLEPGAVNTTIEAPDIGYVLARCQRYYEVIGGAGDFPIISCYSSASGQYIYTGLQFSVPKRAVPTSTIIGTWTTTGCSQPGINSSGINGVEVYILSTSTGQATADAGANKGIAANAEL